MLFCVLCRPGGRTCNGLGAMEYLMSARGWRGGLLIPPYEPPSYRHLTIPTSISSQILSEAKDDNRGAYTSTPAIPTNVTTTPITVETDGTCPTSRIPRIIPPVTSWVAIRLAYVACTLRTAAL